MTPYGNIIWPAYQQPSGRWVQIQMFRKVTTDDHDLLDGIFIDVPASMEEHPWALGGLPEIEDVAAVASGYFGIDSVEFTAHNIAIKPSVDDTTLYELFMDGEETQNLWFVAIWVSAGTTNTFATVPNWILWIDKAQIDGRISTVDKTWSTYKFSARNPLAILERIPVSTWIQQFLLHATFDIDPSTIKVMGIELQEMYFGDKDGAHPYWWRMPWSSLHSYYPIVYPKMFMLTHVLWTIGRAAGLDKPINLGAGTYGAVGATWDFAYADDYSTPTYTDKTFDDLAIVASLYHSDGFQLVHDQKWGFFDPENVSGISVFNLSNVLEALKLFLVPLGCVASLRIDPSDGRLYLHVQQHEQRGTTVTVNDQEVLEGVELEAGEGTAPGMRVVTENNGELVDGSADGDSIDNPYMSAMRLFYGSRWLGSADAGVFDDLYALCASLYVLEDADIFHAVARVTPKNSGTARTTIGAGMPTPPYVTHDITGKDSETAQMIEGGSVIAKAALSYYFNGSVDPETDPVGLMRRTMKRLTWRETGLKLTSGAVGTIRNILGQDWVIRSRRINICEDWTEFVGERGTYDA